MAGGGRDLLVPPSSHGQGPRVGVNPHPQVSRSPPRARLHRLLLHFPACALPQHASPLLSTTSHQPPPSFCRPESLQAADFLRPFQVPPHARPLPRSRTRCRPPARCPSRRHACPRCWGRRRARCDRPRRVYRPPCACARRPLFAHGASARRTRRTASASPTTPPPSRAGPPCTRHTLHPSSITHTPFSIISTLTTHSPLPSHASRQPPFPHMPHPPPCRRTESLVGCSSFVGVRST